MKFVDAVSAAGASRGTGRRIEAENERAFCSRIGASGNGSLHRDVSPLTLRPVPSRFHRPQRRWKTNNAEIAVGFCTTLTLGGALFSAYAVRG